MKQIKKAESVSYHEIERAMLSWYMKQINYDTKQELFRNYLYLSKNVIL